MSLRIKYIAFVVIIHTVIILLTFWLLQANKALFILSEVLILFSLLISVQLYRDFIQPLKFLLTGAEAIKDQDFSVKFRKVGKFEMDKLIEVYNDMIDQLRKERLQVAEQHFFLDKLIQASPIAVVILDFDGRITNLNPKAQILFAQTNQEFMNQPLTALQHAIIPHLSLLENGESRIIHLSGVETYKIQRSFFMDRGFARPFLMLEELTTEMLETEKKAYGKVIRMMAHEVNNSIGAVNSILDITKKHIQDDELLQVLQVATERNDRLNLFMRRFADIVRLPPPNKTLTDLVPLVKNVAQLMKHQAALKNISLNCQPSPAAVMKMIDVAQMEQVLVNIIKNAIEACGDQNEIQIITSLRGIVIRNNGAGIPEAMENQLFTPFFSSKPDGQGIGLTLIREILINHEFAFSLKTGTDGWTEFVINIMY
jgi:nitrogen fixation/metabolism regulation signal transduction histidine kinase